MAAFFRQVWIFIKEIFMFGIDAFMVAAAREVAKRFWARLASRGGAIAALEEGKQTQQTRVAVSSQSSLPFLDEYRD